MCTVVNGPVGRSSLWGAERCDIIDWCSGRYGDTAVQAGRGVMQEVGKSVVFPTIRREGSYFSLFTTFDDSSVLTVNGGRRPGA